MKFARFLQDSQTPEWKKAYIDYRGLKVQLGLIRAQVLRQTDSWTSFGNTDGDHTNYSVPNNEEAYEAEEYLAQRNTTSVDISTAGRRTGSLQMPTFHFALANLPFRMSGAMPNVPSQPPGARHSTSGFPFHHDPEYTEPPRLRTILSGLPDVHTKFFDLLDHELGKVEAFYSEREKEMHERAKLLRKQLDELAIHRQMFYASSTGSKTWNRAKRACPSIAPALSSLIQCFGGPKTRSEKSREVGGHSIAATELGLGGKHFPRPVLILAHKCQGIAFGLLRKVNRRTGAGAQKGLGCDPYRSWRTVAIAKGVPEGDIDAASFPTLDGTAETPSERSNSIPGLKLKETKQPLDPHEYQRAKRRLRNAVFEHYRGLQVLNNYRLLNLTGFRKVLKKYRKITKISVLEAYMKEKVDPCTFSTGAVVSSMLKEMETLFAMRFAHGDKKRAIDHLRVGSTSKTRHFSTFRSGFWLGSALPAIVAGFYQVSQEYTRAQLPSWNILLYIYSILILPVLLALLIGINILIWVKKKISYVFIFKLNLRSKLDHREYFELPSFLLCTLAYAFWFSFAQVGPPTLWPLIWLAMTLLVMFNPFRRCIWGSARWWTIKKTAKLAASGIWVVEFSDVWLGDQFCSLVYTLSHLYFVGCFYTRFTLVPFESAIQPHGDATSLSQVGLSALNSTLQGLLSSSYDTRVQESWATCGANQNWGWYFLLGALPFIARIVQNIRRYRDSKLPSQLINAGKYGMGLIQYLFYCYWRHQNASRTSKSYILWFFTATVYSMYGCAWDVLMDWSMGKPHAQYPLLRPDLVYSSHIPWYYFSLVSNLVIRFIWLSYAFVDDTNYDLWAFIVALLELLRRVQWNIYRLEGKHLHNMGLHRITREVPLPYHFDGHYLETEARLRKRLARLS